MDVRPCETSWFLDSHRVQIDISQTSFGTENLIAFSINEDRGYVVISVKDAPTLDEYVEACRALKSHNQFHPTTHRICDFTGVLDLSVSTRELLAFVGEAKNLPKSNTARTALVGRTVKDRGMMELFASHFDRGAFKVFETGRDALAWVLWNEPLRAATKYGGVRVHRLSGSLVLKDVEELQKGWFAEEGFVDDAPVLWDLREARLGIPIDELRGAASDFDMRRLIYRPEGKSVILVNSRLHEVTFRSVFRAALDTGKLRIYRSETDSYAWLTSSEED